MQAMYAGGVNMLLAKMHEIHGAVMIIIIIKWKFMKFMVSTVPYMWKFI